MASSAEQFWLDNEDDERWESAVDGWTNHQVLDFAEAYAATVRAEEAKTHFEALENQVQSHEQEVAELKLKIGAVRAEERERCANVVLEYADDMSPDDAGSIVRHIRQGDESLDDAFGRNPLSP